MRIHLNIENMSVAGIAIFAALAFNKVVKGNILPYQMVAFSLDAESIPVYPESNDFEEQGLAEVEIQAAASVIEQVLQHKKRQQGMKYF